MNFLTWILLGLIAGIIANIIDPRPARGGILGAIVLGILGALVGGFLSTALFHVGVSGFNIQSLAIATTGALLLLLIRRAFIKN